MLSCSQNCVQGSQLQQIKDDESAAIESTWADEIQDDWTVGCDQSLKSHEGTRLPFPGCCELMVGCCDSKAIRSPCFQDLCHCNQCSTSCITPTNLILTYRYFMMFVCLD